jgi:P27 family predicted phage terminase small subunit
MATRGRKPTPTALKKLEGNPGKRPLNNSEPKPDKKAPSCPKWLEPEAKKEWRRLAKQMEALGILTEVDMAAFAGYCQAYARWKEAEEFITQHGTIVRTPSGYWQQVPQVSIAQTYLKVMNRLPSSLVLHLHQGPGLLRITLHPESSMRWRIYSEAMTNGRKI